jgi:Putative lumazine-binding
MAFEASQFGTVGSNILHKETGLTSRRTSLQVMALGPALFGFGQAAPADPVAAADRACATTSRIVTLTFLQSQPGRLAQLERFVRANWFAMDEVAVKQGLFVSYEWLDTGSDEGPWNAIVTVTYVNDCGFEGIQQRWASIRAAHQEQRPDGLGMKELGRVLETKSLFERAPFTTKLPARGAVVPAQAAPTATVATDADAVRTAVERYFQAADSGRADAVRSAFWPNARVEGVGGGKFLSWSADEFATRNFRGQPRTGTDLARSIEWLDVSGTGAVARVKVTIGPQNTYWDYFVLHKLSGEWKIGLKAFANPERPS